MEHGDLLLDLLKIADLPITALLVLFIFVLWREYVAMRKLIIEWLMERAANGDAAAFVVTDRIRRAQENGK